MYHLIIKVSDVCNKRTRKVLSDHVGHVHLTMCISSYQSIGLPNDEILKMTTERKLKATK